MKKKRVKQTFLVLVTFDLHGVGKDTSVYSRVKKRLAGINLQKFIRSRSSGQINKLPYNTFAAKYPGRLPDSRSSLLRDYVRAQVRKILRAERMSATVFVAIGQRWAWGTARVKRR